MPQVHELMARAAGWEADPAVPCDESQILIVRHPLRPVIFTGPDAWAKAVMYELVNEHTTASDDSPD